jgi:hypothetical protein
MERLTIRGLNKQLQALQLVRSLQTTLYFTFSANGVSNRSACFLFLEQIIYSGKAAIKCSLLPPNVYSSDDR